MKAVGKVMFYLIRFLALMITLVMIVELYWYYRDGGNLIVFVQAESFGAKTKNISIKLDDKFFFDDTITVNSLIPMKHSHHMKVGIHELEIKIIDSDFTLKNRFNLFFVTWVIISVYPDGIVMEYSLIPPLFQ